MAGHPTYCEYKDMGSNKTLPNCPITTHDITTANSMFGTDLSGVRVKTTRNKPSRVDTEEYVNIPEDFKNCTCFLMAGVIFVNGNLFMITLVRKLKFMTVERIPSLTAEQLSKS